MKGKIKLMPAVMTVLSAMYFIYVLTSEDTILAADAVGGDPGGKVLPMVMAVFLFFGFLYITVKERPDGEKMDPGTRRLFLITLGLSVLYVLLIRYAGFVILSTVLLYSLEYIYTTAGEARDKKTAVRGGAGTLGITVAAFFVMRMITRNLMILGRSGVLPGIFAAAAFEGCISLVYVAAVTFVLNRTLCRRLTGEKLVRIKQAGLLTLTTVLFLYVIFKQFFSVNLAAGIFNF